MLKIQNLFVGKHLRIRNFESDDIPDHWNEDGEMDGWRGEIVTVHSFGVDNDHVWINIEEDEGEWMWYLSDFEEPMEKDMKKYNDPNFLFRINRMKVKK